MSVHQGRNPQGEQLPSQVVSPPLWDESLHIPGGSGEGQRKRPVALGPRPPPRLSPQTQPPLSSGRGLDKRPRAIFLTRPSERALRRVQPRRKHLVLIHTFLSAWGVNLSLI